MSTLKRCPAVWNIDEIPLDMPMELNVNISVKIESGLSEPSMSPVLKQNTMALKVSSLSSVKKLKTLIEPLAYHVYSSWLEENGPMMGQKYFKGLRSPILNFSQNEQETPLSGYVSDGGSPYDEDRFFFGISELFLQSLCLRNKHSEFDNDSKPIFRYHVRDDDDIFCYVKLSALKL